MTRTTSVKTKLSIGPPALAVLAAIAMLAPSGAAGQEAKANPHGTFAEDCSLCHGPEGWRPALISREFDHGKRGFALEGAHRRVPCLSCHAKLDFTNAPSECVACHADVHSGELGPDCARCHATTSFVDRADEVRSHRMSRFPLVGAHLALDCSSCHRPASGGHLVFVNTSAECVACHAGAYASAKSPDHAAAGFPRDCEQCHSAASWSGRSFNHALTGFPLSGEHRSLACDACHASGGFTGATAECVACHQDDYDQATNPDHRAAGFPLACGDCHSASSWQGARFDHTPWFPIDSGAHAGEWSQCSQCHFNPASYSDFTCLSCHPHSDRTQTDDDHRGESGYVYDSRECYSCHPNGRH